MKVLCTVRVNSSTPKDIQPQNDLKFLWNPPPAEDLCRNSSDVNVLKLQSNEIDMNPRIHLPYVKASGSVWLFKISVRQHCRRRWRQAWLLMKMAVKPQWELWLCKANAKVFTWVSPSIPAPKIHLFFYQLRRPQIEFVCIFLWWKWMREPAHSLVYMCTLSFTDTNNPTTTPLLPQWCIVQKKPKNKLFIFLSNHRWSSLDQVSHLFD